VRAEPVKWTLGMRSLLTISSTKATALINAAFPNKSRSMGIISREIEDFFPDKALKCPSDAELVAVAKMIPPQEWTEDFDCDDFAGRYYCKARSVSKQGGGMGWAIGQVIFEKTDKVDSPHAMNIAIVDYKGTPTVRVMEPQETGDGAARYFLHKAGPKYVLRFVTIG